jgi:hypothetical protein
MIRERASMLRHAYNNNISNFIVFQLNLLIYLSLIANTNISETVCWQ